MASNKPPKWRCTGYTDDGCSGYQFLCCGKSIESRTGPGWFNTTEDCGPDDPDVRSYTQGDTVRHYHPCEPRYIPVMHFCPFCGTKLEGAIRCEVDNERMLGPRRARIQRMIYDLPYTPPADPKRWWVIQTLEVWPDRESPVKWVDEVKINPLKVGAIKARKELEYYRIQSREYDERSASLFSVKHKTRIVLRKTSHCREVTR